MKTEVNLVRNLFGMDIKQKSKSEFFSLTDLVKAGNKYRTSIGLPVFNQKKYLDNKSTKEFIQELNHKYNCISYVPAKHRGQNTWVHPLLFIDIALAIDPKLRIEVYEWLFDQLIKYRNDSGNSYKEMSASIYKRYSNHKEFPNYMRRACNYIKDQIGVSDWNKATEKQLQLRDRVHRSIITLSNVLTDTNRIIKLAVKEHIK